MINNYIYIYNIHIGALRIFSLTSDSNPPPMSDDSLSLEPRPLTLNPRLFQPCKRA